MSRRRPGPQPSEPESHACRVLETLPSSASIPILRGHDTPTRRLATPHARGMSAHSKPFRVLVVGGGVVGLATAWQLARRGTKDVALVERWRFGHDRASSHGFARITRSSYPDARDVRLMQVAHAEDWPALERDAGMPLLHRTPGAFFGPADGPFEAYAAAVASAGADVERLSPSEARGRFPLFRFPDAAGVLHDRTAAVVAAADTMRALARRCWVEGVHALENTRVLRVDTSCDPIEVVTDRGMLRAEHVVLAAGPWLRDLVPALAGRLTVRRQSVAYFALEAPSDRLGVGEFPVWAYLGPGENGLRYGLPEFRRTGVKAGWHEVAGSTQDPEDGAGPDVNLLERVRAFLGEQLAVRVGELLHAETCLYTSTASEEFILDALAGDPRVIVASACSGHGFKFAPLTGRILAGLVLDGHSGVEAFERQRERFR